MKRIITAFILGLVFSMTLTASASETGNSKGYIHDPMENPKAAKDIVVNPAAVYGYSPNPESQRMKEFADYDWTDEALVNEMKTKREEYHESLRDLYDMIASMKASGSTVEEIARAVSTRRNEIRMESYKDDPEGLEKLKKSNLDSYGNETGGTPDYFYEKYGSWETVIEKALSSNPGADACVGLYDEYYDTYFIIQPETYTVQAGDCLMSIAYKLLGDRELWTTIYNLNSSEINDPNLIYPGQVLKISAQ